MAREYPDVLIAMPGADAFDSSRSWRGMYAVFWVATSRLIRCYRHTCRCSYHRRRTQGEDLQHLRRLLERSDALVVHGYVWTYDGGLE